MKEQFLNHELSKQFKELGFDERCLSWYRIDGTHVLPSNLTMTTTNTIINQRVPGLVMAPLIQQAEQFLIDKFGCHIVIIPEPHKTGINYNWQVMFYDPTDELCWSKLSTWMYGDDGEYPTDRAARIAGIEKAVEIIMKYKT